VSRPRRALAAPGASRAHWEPRPSSVPPTGGISRRQWLR
jgi:hypothetical protein